jgi:hypothetical protein
MDFVLRNLRHLTHVPERGLKVLVGRRFGLISGHLDHCRLRPHQRHPWHALLCQLGALACLRSGLAAPPADAEGWRTALRVLTPDFPDDEPWMLVTPPGRPAFLQAAAVGGLKDFRSLVTADALDVLVTAKNHDVKSARLIYAEPDDWLFALVALQTSEGYFVGSSLRHKRQPRTAIAVVRENWRSIWVNEANQKAGPAS